MANTIPSAWPEHLRLQHVVADSGWKDANGSHGQRQPSFDKRLFSVQLGPARGGYVGSPASF